MNNPSLTKYISALIDELAQVGISTCIISPGSRSTPLALLMAEHPQLQTYINVDERSAGFFALGAAKSTGIPTVLTCTSGTAAANYLPAVIEAAYSRIPLVILTSDRPHELREVGAPQAIDQIHLYQRYAKSFFEAAIPEDTDEMIQYARNLIRRAVAAAMKPPMGPVHINIPLREPLIPDLHDPKLFTYGRSDVSTRICAGKFALQNDEYDFFANEIMKYRNGIIICGPLSNVSLFDEIIKFATQLQFPILADPLSNLRLAGKKSEYIIETYDAFLKNEIAVKALKPEVIIRIGAMPVSKSLLLAIKNHWHDVRQVIIDGGGTWREPTGFANEMVYCDEQTFLCEIAQRITRSVNNTSWTQLWRTINEQSKKVLATIRENDELSEGKICFELNELLPNGSQLFIANSMPIRDIDTFLFHHSKQVDLFCNRGANGIDGTISSALGASLNGKPTVLLTGDLSFFHDLNGLAASKLNDLSLTIILVNNDGGGIFSFLPQAENESAKKHFHRLFITSLNLPFELAAKLYDANYVLVDNWVQFREEVSRAIHAKGIHIIEVQTNREKNVMEHRALWKNVSESTEPLLKGIPV